MNGLVEDVVIVGRDAPLWLAACVLQSALGPAGVRVSVVELPGTMGPADVYATLPALEPLHARLRIDEARLIAATRGAYTLGKQFHDASGGSPPFFHAYGSTGARIDEMDFLPHWIKARHLGLPAAYQDFSLTAAAALHGRMLVPDPEIERHGFTDYGYHLPAIPYGEWLKQLALRRGVMAHETTRVTAMFEPGSDRLAGVTLDGGFRVMGDFFVDVTGEESTLIGAALGIRRESWRDSFPADRVLVAHGPPLASMPVYADIRAGATGWVGLHPSQVCTHVVHAYSGVDDDKALANASGLAQFALAGARVRAHTPGRGLVAWERNCVAIGESACVFDALHGVELQAVQVGLVHLLPLFPVDGDFAVERAEYNQNIRAAFERIRDFQSAHYVLNRYRGSFWERARLGRVSADLMRRIGVFRARGELAHYEDESFSIDDWRQLLLGHGVLPESWDPAADRTDPAHLKDELRRLLGFIRRKVETQRTHASWLAESPRPPH